MKTKEQQKQKLLLIEAIENLFELPEFEDAGYWVGDNLAELMADAAYLVYLANNDVQDYMKKENISTI